MRRHLQEQVSIYGEQALVNLVNRKGHEQPVKEAYERYVQQVRFRRCSVAKHLYIHSSSISPTSDTSISISTTNASTCAGIVSVCS
jgi:hypothetical protein